MTRRLHGRSVARGPPSTPSSSRQSVAATVMGLIVSCSSVRPRAVLRRFQAHRRFGSGLSAHQPRLPPEAFDLSKAPSSGYD
jgi:hypothetical protein